MDDQNYGKLLQSVPCRKGAIIGYIVMVVIFLLLPGIALVIFSVLGMARIVADFPGEMLVIALPLLLGAVLALRHLVKTMNTRVDFYEKGFCYHGRKKQCAAYDEIELVLEEQNRRRGTVYHVRCAKDVIKLPQNYYGHEIYDIFHQLCNFEE